MQPDVVPLVFILYSFYIATAYAYMWTRTLCVLLHVCFFAPVLLAF